MFKANNETVGLMEGQLTVTEEQGMKMMGCGRHTFKRIAEESGAKINVPTRRNLYSVRKIEEYLNSH